MPTRNIGMCCTMMEMKAGSPPTPMAGANTPLREMKTAPRAEPVSAA